MAESLNPIPQAAPGVYTPEQAQLTPSQEKLRYFEWEHLPEPLRGISQQCANLAETMQELLPDGPQKTLGLQKLIEAKDCFVRAALPKTGKAYIGKNVDISVEDK